MHASLRVCLGRVAGQAMVVLGFGLRWGTPAEAVHEPAGVIPVNPCEVISSTSARVSSGPVRNGEPSRMHSVLYRPYSRFRERVIKGIPDGSYRWRQVGQHQRLGEMHAGILASRIRMMNGTAGYRVALPRPVSSCLAYC
jgi:hypothetical protein